MTARRSQDPTAQEHDDGASSAVEHWTPQRREAAIPARRELTIPPDSSTAEGDVEDDRDGGPSETGTREVACDDGAAGQASDQSSEK